MRLRVLASLGLAVILLATIGGFGSIFNFLVSSEIRCYNRISVFLAFLSFIAFAHLLRAIEGKLSLSVAYLGGAVLLFLGISDQASFAYLRSMHGVSAIQYDETKSFVQVLEKRLAPGARVFQIPYVPYPNTPSIVNMTSHAHFLAYVVSHSLNWSWPALSGPALTFNANLGNCAPRELIANLVQFDFAGIWINRRAYGDGGKKIMSELEIAANAPRIVSPGGAYAFIPLHSIAGRLATNIKTSHDLKNAVGSMATISLGSHVDFSSRGRNVQYLGSGWSGQEPELRWTEGPQASLLFTFPASPEADVVLTARASALLTAKHPRQEVEIVANDVSVGHWTFSLDSSVPPLECKIPVELFGHGAQLRLKFLIKEPVSPSSLEINGDQRLLGIAVQELGFEVKR